MKTAPDLSVAGRFITQDLDGYTRGVLAAGARPVKSGKSPRVFEPKPGSAVVKHGEVSFCSQHKAPSGEERIQAVRR